MPDEKLSVKFSGVQGDEIADYAVHMLHCNPCQAGPGLVCKNAEPGRQVCRDRFQGAVKVLAMHAEKGIRYEFDLLAFVKKPGTKPCECRRCLDWRATYKQKAAAPAASVPVESPDGPAEVW